MSTNLKCYESIDVFVQSISSTVKTGCRTILTCCNRYLVMLMLFAASTSTGYTVLGRSGQTSGSFRLDLISVHMRENLRSGDL